MFRQTQMQFSKEAAQYNGLTVDLVTRIPDLVAATGETVNSGKLASLTTALKLQLGCGNANYPLLVVKGQDSSEVGAVGTAAAPAVNSMTGNISVIVPITGVEYAVPTTGYNTADAASYVPTTLLTAGTSSLKGLIVPAGTYYSDAVRVGMVTRGIKKIGDYNFLVFVAWPETAVKSDQFTAKASA